jgi:hypothetical protein
MHVNHASHALLKIQYNHASNLAGSWQVFHVVGLCVFSHQSADYSIVVVHLTSNSFEGYPCCMHAKQHWLPNWRLSTRTVRNRLKSAGLKSRRVIKRPLLVDRHQRSRLAWCFGTFFGTFGATWLEFKDMAQYLYMYVVYFVMYDSVLILLLSYGHHYWFNEVFL